MTLLNTVSNLGSKWPNSLSLYLLPKMTVTTCEVLGATSGLWEVLPGGPACWPGHTRSCTAAGGSCMITFDGYTIQSGLCLCIGVAWFFFFRETVERLDKLPLEKWWITRKNSAASELASSSTDKLL